ncbi:uncharacterized protein LOC133884017 [Phragmites australis]|uniref:uncharacterized protein LOC133884017 n=1 Tax=Phragmites australis TaxID=29695 RepID=UPI002D798850|nr:uncharacterized protein LOC133884017 [Phragmites australis]
MSRLLRDPHPRTTKKPSASTSAAAQHLLRHGGREAADGESIEFFSTLRKCQPDPRVCSQTGRGQVQPADRRGKARRGGSGDELLSTEIGKRDYDWLRTPPATPLWSPATSASGHQISAAVPSRLAKAGSASYTKSNSRLGPTGREKENATSRLSKCSSATRCSSADTPAIAPSGRLLRVRTSSSAPASSIHNAASNASVGSTPSGSAKTRPRTPATGRSAAVTARPCHQDKARSVAVVGRSRASTKPWLPVSASSREQATPRSGVSGPRSTTSTSRQSALARRADVVARSRLASQSSGTGSTIQAVSPTPVNLTRGARAVLSNSNCIKTPSVPVAVKQNGAATASATTQRWRQCLSPAIAAARNVRSEDSLGNGSPRNSATRNIHHDKRTGMEPDGKTRPWQELNRRGFELSSRTSGLIEDRTVSEGLCKKKIHPDKATPQRTAPTAAGGSGLTRTGSRKSGNTTYAKRKVNENGECRRQDAKHGGAPAQRKPTLLQQSIRSVASKSRQTATSVASSTSRGQSTPENGRHAAAAAARVAGPDAFPSMRYDAMLLREDPKNLTWLCDDGNDSGGGSDLIDGSLEPFDVAIGLA